MKPKPICLFCRKILLPPMRQQKWRTSTAKIYQVMAKLLDKGVVLELVESGKKRYVPMEPDEFIARQKVRMNRNLSSLKRAMGKDKEGDQCFLYLEFK
jgi:hypothetical protein